MKLHTTEEFLRFNRKVQVNPTTGCWEWIGRTAGNGTYGGFGRNAYAHRVVWETWRGPIPKKLTVDHLCRNRKCVRVDHMELVTRGENTMRGDSPWAINKRKTHCNRGHKLSGDNLRLKKQHGKTFRLCVTCHRESVKRARQKQKED